MSAWQAWCLSVALPSLVPKHRSTSIRVGRESTLAVGSALGLEAWSSVQSVQGLAGNARRRPALRLGNPLRQRLYACHPLSAGSRPCGLANVCRAPGILCPVKLGLHCSPWWRGLLLHLLHDRRGQPTLVILGLAGHARQSSLRAVGVVG